MFDSFFSLEILDYRNSQSSELELQYEIFLHKNLNLKIFRLKASIKSSNLEQNLRPKVNKDF